MNPPITQRNHHKFPAHTAQSTKLLWPCTASRRIQCSYRCTNRECTSMPMCSFVNSPVSPPGNVRTQTEHDVIAGYTFVHCATRHTAKAAANALQALVTHIISVNSNYRVRVIRSDRGTEFRGAPFRSKLRELDIEQRLTLPQSQSKAAIVVRTKRIFCLPSVSPIRNDAFDSYARSSAGHWPTVKRNPPPHNFSSSCKTQCVQSTQASFHHFPTVCAPLTYYSPGRRTHRLTTS